MTVRLAAAILAASPVFAQASPAQVTPAPAACPVQPAALHPALAGFAHPAALPREAPLTIGRASIVGQIANPPFVLPPAKKPAAGELGSAVTFTVTAAGRYRVALGVGVWVDVVANGTALASVAHDHGPPCSLVRKMVDFDLKPGRHTLQLSGTRAMTVTVEVVRVG